MIFFKPVVDQTTDLKDVAILTGGWHIYSASPCEGGASIDSHHSILKCWSFHKHFINFVPSYEGLCFAFVLWSKGAETDCCLVLPLLQGFRDVREPLLSDCTQPCFWWQALSPDSPWRYSSYWRSEEPRWNQFIYLLPVLVKTVQFWFFRTSCQLEKKKDKQISQLALDSTVLRLDTVSRESGSTVQKTLVIHQRCTYC